MVLLPAEPDIRHVFVYFTVLKHNFITCFNVFIIRTPFPLLVTEDHEAANKAVHHQSTSRQRER